MKPKSKEGGKRWKRGKSVFMYFCFVCVCVFSIDDVTYVERVKKG